MIIKNYHTPPMLAAQPALDLQIIEDVTDVLVYAGLSEVGQIGNLEKAGVTTVYCSGDNNHENKTVIGYGQGQVGGAPRFTRHIDFTRRGVRCRLIVTEHAYVCNDEGKTVEKVSA